jgi:hypothetical protein
MSKRVTAAHAVRPSGDTVGLPMRLIAQSASTVKPRAARRLDRGTVDRAPPERAIANLVVRMSVRDSTSAGPLGARPAIPQGSTE